MSAMLRAGVLVATLAVLLGIASAIPVLAQSELDTGDQVVVINGTLKLRTEASVTSDVIEVLAEGTVLTVISDPVDADGLTWVQVRTATGAEGWVSSQHVEAAPPVPPQVGDTVSVESGPLNLRETASTEASVIGKLETGDRVEVVDGPVASGDYSWYQVESKDGKRGWVASDFIKVAPPEGFDPGNEVVVAIGPVNMREGSSIESEIIVTLDQGTTLTVISGPVAGGDYTWFAVKREDGETGFVVETALEPVAGERSNRSTSRLDRSSSPVKRLWFARPA
ncbi:MAG: SH3 domain-containing protein [Thermomicrobiales bacterium]